MLAQEGLSRGFDLLCPGSYTTLAMVPLLTASEMREMDRLAIEEIGIPSVVLMETAGRAVANLVHERSVLGTSVLVLCGLGNNGGDGIVAARHLLNQDHPVTVVLLGNPDRASADLRSQLEIAGRLGIDPLLLDADRASDDLALLLNEHDVAIDAIFGTGLSREVEGVAKTAIEALNDAPALVISVDLPSGVDADTGQLCGVAVEADLTVTFALPKLGHVLYPGRAHAAETMVVDIGIPYALLERVQPKAELLDSSVIEPLWARRHPDTHKGTYGHLLVVGGCPERPGAALLTSRAALRVGAGLVSLGSDIETVRRLAPALDELMGLGLGAEFVESSHVIDAVKERSALAIGPSLPVTSETGAMVREVLEQVSVPAVVDAGALQSLGERPAWLSQRKAPTVVTPHPGEMAGLLGCGSKVVQSDRVKAARELSDLTRAVVVLKGASTVIADPLGGVSVIGEGNAGMATAGMGALEPDPFSTPGAGTVPSNAAARLVWLRPMCSTSSGVWSGRGPRVVVEFRPVDGL
jgi:NAD(P)H-hydrate epimerase